MACIMTRGQKCQFPSLSLYLATDKLQAYRPVHTQTSFITELSHAFFTLPQTKKPKWNWETKQKMSVRSWHWHHLYLLMKLNCRLPGYIQGCLMHQVVRIHTKFSFVPGCLSHTQAPGCLDTYQFASYIYAYLHQVAWTQTWLLWYTQARQHFSVVVAVLGLLFILYCLWGSLLPSWTWWSSLPHLLTGAKERASSFKHGWWLFQGYTPGCWATHRARCKRQII